MSKLRVNDMAGEFGISVDEVINLLRQMDVPVRSHMTARSRTIRSPESERGGSARKERGQLRLLLRRRVAGAAQLRPLSRRRLPLSRRLPRRRRSPSSSRSRNCASR